MTIPDIASFVPHTRPMLLLDRVIDADQNTLCSEVRINSDSLFCHKGNVAAWIGIEYMAQTVAAHAGFLACQDNEPVRVGFLLGTRLYQSHVDTFPAGTVLKIQVERQYLSEEGLGSYKCRILEKDLEVAMAILTVYQPSDSHLQQETS